MKIVFLGTPLFSSIILEKINSFNKVSLVVTKVDTPVGRKQVLTPSVVKEKAMSLNLEVVTPNKVSELLPILDNIKPDILITAAYGKMIPDCILNKYLTINLHASLLPKYRGGSPIEYSLLNDDKKTGITIMRLVKQMDAGPILMQEELPILDNENKTELTLRLANLASEMIIKYLQNINTYKEVTQDEDKVSYAYNLGYADQILDLEQKASVVNNKIRALSLIPGAFIKVNDTIVKLIKCELTNIKSTPYQIKLNKNELLIGTKDYFLKVLTLQQSGKKVMTIKDYLNGQKLFIDNGKITNYLKEYGENNG